MTTNKDVQISRRLILGGAAAAGLGVAGVSGATTAHAQSAPTGPSPMTVQTFDSMPIGQSPAGAQVVGTAVVDTAAFGGVGNRAVHLTDTSTTVQTQLLFPAEAAPARRFSFDLTFEQVQQGLFVAVQGVGASAALGAWRFMVSPNHGRNRPGLIQVYNGSAWQRVGVVTDLTLRGHVSRVTIEASPEAAVISVGDFRFRVTTRASAHTAITGLQFASSSSTGTGTNAWIDNVGTQTLAASDTSLKAGVVARNVIESYTYGAKPAMRQVAVVDVSPTRLRDLTALVHVAGVWQRGVLTAGPNGTVIVRAKVVDPNIGEHPVTVTIRDSRAGTTLSAQGRAQSYGQITPEVIATEVAPMQPRFVDAVRLADGALLLAYQAATAHTNANNGHIRVIRSTDDGATWSAPVTVADSQYDDRDPKVAQLRDGTVLLTTFRTEWVPGSSTARGTWVHRSTDGGFTFDAGTKLESAEPGAWEHGPALELPNGDVLQPLYGWGARVARSKDGGRTFKAADELMVLREVPGRYYQEPNIIRLASGELIMSIRTQDSVWGQEIEMLVTRSFDDGYTWSEPEKTDMPASSHHTLLASDGSVLVAWGNQWQDGRPTYVTRIANPSGPWTGYRHVPLYNSRWYDQANPSSVELRNGRFLTFGTNVVDRTVVQVEHAG